ncbi:MAG TPA: LssY C-terminal domain-containing protein [Terriglobales bacterium]|jgi:hypothetical protein
MGTHHVSSCLLTLLFIGLMVILSTQTAAQSAPRDYTLTITTSQPWTDTEIDLLAGDVLTMTAAELGCDPQGVKGATATDLPIASASPGALIAKLQSQGTALLVSSKREIHVPENGHLFLGVNASGNPPCQGGFSVKAQVVSTTAVPLAMTRTDAAAASKSGDANGSFSQTFDLKNKLSSAAQIWMAGQFGNGSSTAAKTTSADPSTMGMNAPGTADSTANAATRVTTLKVSDAPLDAALRKDLDGLPRRVNDEFNNLGDMVNFVLVGSQQQVQSALDAADWHVADTDNKSAVVQAVIQTAAKKDYLTMPMSQLMLFGRYQDFGYEQAEPIAMVASRHHFRIWKAPFTWNGQPVWVGAGTHDIGFEKDQRNGKVTHKIDPAVDGERENIGESLQKAEKVKSLTYYLPPKPVQMAKNATGGTYHSDGRLLVVFLK